MARAALAALAVACILAVCSAASVPYVPGMKTIGTSIKGGFLPANTELTIFEYTGAGCITEQWFAGVGGMDSQTRIRVYVDGETAQNVSLDFNLFLAHAVGTDDATEAPNTPWATQRIAHTADGSIYNTIRIPFGTDVRITAEHPTGGSFWYIVRGVENYPVILGDLQLPASARLKLHKIENVMTQPLDFVTLVNVTANVSGALSFVTCRGISPDLNYLEACFRAYIDGNDTPIFLSSGAEDFFLSSYYFKTGLYHHPNSGCTAKILDYVPPGTPSGTNYTLVTAYKFFENDPVLFSDGFKLVWRNEEEPGKKNGCPTTWPPNVGEHSLQEVERQIAQQQHNPFSPGSNVAFANYTTYAWVYQW